MSQSDQVSLAVNMMASSEEAQVARFVREAGAISKTELARRTGLSRAVLNSRLTSLRKLNLIEDVGLGPSTGGRPPSLLRFAETGGTVVSVDLGATSIDVAITNLGAELLEHVAEKIDIRAGPKNVLDRAGELIDEVLSVDPQARERLKGVGVGVPGPVEFDTGRPVSPPIMPGWDQFPVRDYFEERYGRPTFVDNDVNLMALGEVWFGVGTPVKNLLWIKLGTGIGCGILSSGHIYRGSNGCAGDIGHIDIGRQERVCRCGNIGCLEAVAGGYALGLAAEELAVSGESPSLSRLLNEQGVLSAMDLGVAVIEGDRASIELIRTAGVAIGAVLAGLVNFYNPEMIVIGGGVAQIGDRLLASIRESVYRRSLPLATRSLVITGSALEGRAGVIGGAAMVLGELYGLATVAQETPRASHRGRD